MITKLVRLLAGCTTLVAVAHGQTELITNGSFEPGTGTPMVAPDDEDILAASGVPGWD